ncbi:MAG: helix-turn-helix transcriptional regulator [Ruminococcaceae bacterium]|nr:helix-turn-helix transcriptional regulator [Oscillospiraceae bacterium]
MELKQIIAHNIVDLRHIHGLTQAELAKRLNYSDKAVSKWERGESLPDITVLKNISEIFEVSVDYLLAKEHTEIEEEPEEMKRLKLKNRKLITVISLLLVCFIATFVFVLIRLITGGAAWNWLIFAYAVPVCAIVGLVFNSVWFNPRNNYVIISLLMWSLLAVIFFTFSAFSVDTRLLYTIGVPGQIIIILWSGIRNIPKKLKKKKKSAEE